jgi:hypothetical protein
MQSILKVARSLSKNLFAELCKIPEIISKIFADC